MNLTEEIMTAFWSRVEKRQPEECWLWTGNVDRQGRGKFWVSGTGRHYRAPRVALIASSGFEPPTTIFACHTCDNPACCNPSHLWWGSRSDNMRDCGAKGRHGWQLKYRGSNNPQSKLTECAVRDIRARYQAGESPKSIGQDHNIKSGSVWRIATGKSWAHVQ